MKKVLIFGCAAIVLCVSPLPRAVAQDVKPSKIAASPTAKPAPTKVNAATAVKPAKQKINASPVVAPGATAISTKAATGESKALRPAMADTAKAKGAAKAMTHEQIQKMMAEREQVFKEMQHKPAPDFTVTDLNGKSYSLADLRGKTVVLNFWFIGCKPCVMEMPHLNDVVDKYKNRDVVFIAMALDKEPALRKFLEKTEFNYNIIPDAGALIQNKYKVNSFPTSMVIDKHGNLQDYTIGYSENVGEAVAAMIKRAQQVK